MNNQILQETIREWHSKTPDSVHGVGWGYKVTNGITTDEPCLVFAVVSKKPLSELTKEEILPTTLIVDNETVKTDVVEMGIAQALSNCYGETDASSSDHRVSHRSLVGGISISHNEAGATAGTLGGMFKDKEDGSVVGLTNLHVVCPLVNADGVWSAERAPFHPWDIESKTIIQQGHIDGGGGTIGNIKRYYPMSISSGINYIDAAVIGLDSSSLIDSNSGSQLGPLSPVNYPVATTAEIDGLLVNGNFLVKSGRTTGYVGSSSACRIVVLEIGVSRWISYSGGLLAVSDLLTIHYANNGPNVCVGGDSGSILLADFGGTLKIVGLIFAGGTTAPYTSSNNYGLACRIDRVMDMLNLEAVGSTTLINPPSNWEFIDRIPVLGIGPNINVNGRKYWECGKLASSGNTKYVTYYPAPSPPPPPSPTPSPSLCADRVVVIQICNSNSLSDDNFDISLNSTIIARNINLNSMSRVGAILIGSTNESLFLAESTFLCPIPGMSVHYFNPNILAAGTNLLHMINVQNNNYGNYGMIQVKSFETIGSELRNPCDIDSAAFCRLSCGTIIDYDSINGGESMLITLNIPDACCGRDQSNCCAGPDVPCDPPIPRSSPRPSPTPSASPCITVCPPGYVLDPASCLCSSIPMCGECATILIPDLGPVVNGYIFYVDYKRTVYIPEIGDVMTSCGGGHACCNAEFNPILQFTNYKVDANKYVNVNNIPCGLPGSGESRAPRTPPLNWPVPDPGLDRADTFEFNVPDWSDIANCEIQLECPSGYCHSDIAFVALVAHDLSDNPILIFNACISSNTDFETNGLKLGVVCSGDSGDEKPCVSNVCVPECNYANFMGGVNIETTVMSNGGPSAYCTYDQAGNASEWTDGDGIVQRSTTRLFGGGWWDGSVKSDYSWPDVSPETHNATTGFRLCSSIDLSRLTVSNFVFVADKGNHFDSTGLGSVAVNYYIQQSEVTNGQYCDFLNSVAKTDTYDLCISGMKITRTGISGNYRYSPNLTYRDRPVVHVTYWNAARMANWISNGQPVGFQDATTTEDGAYIILSGFDIQPVNAINPNTLAAPTCFIPTEDMWYKAAYYKGGGTSAGYWQYATQYNVAPNLVTSVLPNGDGVVPNPCVPSPSPSPSVSPSPSPSPSPSVSPSPSPSVCPGCRSTLSPFACMDGVGYFDCIAMPTGEWVMDCCP